MFDAAPIRTATQTVQPDWIDYNGHMNVAYYTLAFDRALDGVFDDLGIGEAAVKSRNQGPMALQAMIHYRAEMLEGTAFACDFRLLDWDHKRVHIYADMLNLDTGDLAAVYESISINVDLGARRSTSYPQEVQDRLSALHGAQKDLPRPKLAGASIGIRRR